MVTLDIFTHSYPIKQYAILSCLNEIGFQYPDGTFLDLKNKSVNPEITYSMVYDFLYKTYGIKIMLILTDDNLYKIDITEGIDISEDIYNIITALDFKNMSDAYEQTCFFIVSDLNWRHKLKRKFSAIK